MSTIEVNTIAPISGSNDVTLGGSSKNIKFASGTTVDFSTNTPTTTLGSTMKATPAFFAKQGSTQAISSLTWTKMNINTETFDSDSKYDTSNYRFTPTVAGKYFCYGQVNISDGSENVLVQIAMYKNGSQAFMCVDRFPDANDIAVNIQVVLDLDTDDYVEAYARHSRGSNSDVLSNSSFFGAYRIIGA